MKSVTFKCKDCRAFGTINFEDNEVPKCPACGSENIHECKLCTDEYFHPEVINNEKS